MDPRVVFLVLVIVPGCYLSPTNISLYKIRSLLHVSEKTAYSVEKSIADGAEVALEHCQSIFRWDRWNCSTTSLLWTSNRPPNRETAFSNAILSAGVVHALIKSCSKGEISDCGCDTTIGQPSALTTSNSLNSPKQHFHNLTKNGNDSVHFFWGGCSDDPVFAFEVSKKFLDGLKKGSDVAALVIKQFNEEVGREIVRHSMVKKCRCHGVSGSCSLQTCSMKVASFGEIADKLRKKYIQAVRLSHEVLEESIGVDNSVRQFDKQSILGKTNNLVYLVQSPDYCIPNLTQGYFGTKGRICKKSISEVTSPAKKKSCRVLCNECGYRVGKIQKPVARYCNCKFVWCCEMKCETCIEYVNEYYCY